MFKKKLLPNGARVLFEEIPYVRSASVGIWIGNGSRYENKEENGISHFIEHMLFKGTPSRSAAQLASVMDAMGGQFNAFTTKEATSFFFRALDSDIPAGIELLGDMLLNSSFPAAELDVERGVVREEIDMYEDTPDELATERLFGAVFPDSPLGFQIIGERKNLDAMDGAALARYKKAHYVGANAVAAISGNFKPADIDALCDVLSGFPNEKAPGYMPAVYKPTAIEKEKKIEQNHICLGFRGIPYGDPRRYAAQVASSILGGGMSSRLFRRVREESGLCYSIYTFQSPHADVGVSGVYVATNPSTQAQAVRLIEEEVERFVQDGPTEEELERTRGQIKANVLMGLESTLTRMNHMARSELMMGYVPTPEEIVAAYDRVDMNSCRAAAAVLFDSSTRATSVVGKIQ